MGKITVTPKKPLPTWALAGVVFLLFSGIGFFRYMHGVLTENGEPSCFSIVYFLWMAAWIGTGLYPSGQQRAEPETREGIVPGRDRTGTGVPGDSAQSSPMQRLRDLERLKADGLVTEEEYRRKREEMMREKW